MNYSQAAAPSHAGMQPQAPVKTPGMVLAAVITTVLAALSGAIGALFVYTGGKEFVEENVRTGLEGNASALGLDAESAKGLKSGPLFDSLVTDWQGTMNARAGVAIFLAVVLLLCALFVARKGAIWARVIITIVAVVWALFPNGLIISDYPPDKLFITSLAAILLGVVALILVWLPPVNRYAKARKAAN